MKTLTSFFLVALLSVSSVFATDETIVANWQFPIDGWFAGAAAPAEGIAAYTRAVAPVSVVTGFDAATANFDAAWTTAGAENILGAVGRRLGLAGSENGAADFTGSFKVLYDDNNIYILLKWTDDDVTGTESAEVCLSPYLKLNVADRVDAVGSEWFHASTAWYTRYSQFGANKLLFKKTGFKEAMMVNFTGAGVGSINWGGTTATLTNNLFLDDKTAPASKTVKWIISIGYPVLTGEHRPTFDKTNLLNGVSFDLKINDTDADDALNADATPVAKPAEYWWNTTSNDCWQANFYAGFLAKAISVGTAVHDVKMIDFAKITANTIELSAPANVTVYNAIGKEIINVKNTSIVNISNLKKGAYIVSSNNQSQKFVR